MDGVYGTHKCLRLTFPPRPARIDVVVKKLGKEAETTLEYMEHKLHLVETLGAARDHIRFLLDPLAEYMAALRVLETYASSGDG